MHDAAEYLAMGQLLRRNILAYKAPPRNEGYDLICIHPDPRRRTKVVRVQVKSRYQTDSDRSVFVREKSFPSFDFLVIVFLNIGWYYDPECARPRIGRQKVEFLTLPRSVARRLYSRVKSEMNRVRTQGHSLDRYKNETGFELIAKELHVPYPRP
jgi:hypothetical protein